MSLEKPCDSPSSSIDQLRTTCEKKFMVPGASHVAGASPCSTAASERDDQQPLAVVNMRSGMLPCLGRQRTAMLCFDIGCHGTEGHCSPEASESDNQQPLAVVNMRSGMLPCLQRQRSAMWILDGDCCEVDGQAGHARRSLRCRTRSWMVRALKLA
jgi:hypothetical protein